MIAKMKAETDEATKKREQLGTTGAALNMNLSGRRYWSRPTPLFSRKS